MCISPAYSGHAKNKNKNISKITVVKRSVLVIVELIFIIDKEYYARKQPTLTKIIGKFEEIIR